jgi:phospholipase A1
LQDVLGTPADLWFGYTQQSYWQAANRRYSSFFRETNYQPEIIAMRALPWKSASIDASYVALSVVHESNGRGESLSRSWNRVIGEVAFEAGPWVVHLRPWARVDTASGANDDNPDIQDFVGRGEAIVAFRKAGHVVTFTGRHTLRSGANSRGSARLDWAFPVVGHLNGHLQLFSGYGESLIDYNHRQTTLGVGVSFFD